MFRKKTDENREILLQAFYNLEDKLVQKLGTGSNTIAFTAADDNTNKTASVVNMAHHLAEDGDKVLIIDANLRYSELADVLGNSSDTGFVDVILGDYDIDEVLISDQKYKTLDIMHTGDVAAYADKFLEPAVIRDFFADISESYDYVFIDLTPNYDIAEANMFAANADGVVVFTTSQNASRTKTRDSLSQLEKVNANILGLIIAGYDYSEDELDDLFGGNDE